MKASERLRQQAEKEGKIKSGTTSSVLSSNNQGMKASERLRQQAEKEGKLKSGTVTYVPQKKSPAGNSPASSSIGSTLNPRAAVTIPKPTMANFKALTTSAAPATGSTLNPVAGVMLPKPTMANFKALTTSAAPATGSTLNPVARVMLPKPTMAGFKALTEKKQPTVNINLDQKPIQNRATVNPSFGAAVWADRPQRSTSIDRKTMLYETNDSLLSNEEILEKYRYVVNDKEMDTNTRDLAAKKGLAITGRMRDKSLFGGERNGELIQAITALQGDLTYMTKAYARGKGYGDAYGLNYVGRKLSDNYVENRGDPQLKAAVEARKKLGQKTMEGNPLSVMAGRFVGEGVKYAAFSPAIEAGVGKATSALGARMSASTASTAAQQLYALGKYNPAISKGLQFGGNLLGMQAADTLLYTPTVILEGMEAGKDKKQIAKDVAGQQAMDLGFNLGFSALGAGAKALKGAKNGKSKAAGASLDSSLSGPPLKDNAPTASTNSISNSSKNINQNLIRNEDAKPTSVTSPPDTSKTANQLSSNNNISATLENINHNLAKTESEISASEMKELGFSGRVAKLLDTENKKALDEELKALVGGKEVREKFEAIVDQYGFDSPELSQFIKETAARKTEIAETLGYADNVTLKEETKAVNEALRELRSLTSVRGKENTKVTKGLLQDAAADVRQYGSISSETKERIYNEMVSMGKTSNREMIDQNLKDTLKKTVLRISNMDAANIPDFEQFRKSLFGKIGGISKGGKGEYVDVAYKELHELFPERFPGEIVHPAEQLEQIARVAEDLKIKETPLLEAMSKEECASLEESFHASLAKVEENLQRVIQRQTERKEKQIRKVMASEMKMKVDSLSTKDMEGLFNERYQLEKELERAKKRASLTNWEKDKVKQLLYAETSLEEVAKASVSADSVKRITDVYNVEKQLRQIEGTIGDYRTAKDVGRKNFIADAVGEISVARDGKKGWKDMNPFQMGRLIQERIIEKVAGKKETAKRIIEKFFAPIHTAERDRQLFIREITDRVKKLNIDTKKKYVIRDADNQVYQLSESGLVHYLGSKRYELLKLERKGNAISQLDAELINRFRQEISSAESAVSKEQLARIDHGIQEFQDIYKKIHPQINEVLIRNGYDPIGYIDGYFPNMFFDDATDPMGKVLQKVGFDFAGKELPMDIAGRTENFRPGKKFAENLLQRTSNRTDYDALRAMDKYLDDISDVIYHTDNIKNLREYEEHLRYTLSPDGVKAEADAIKKNSSLSAENIREKLDTLYKDNSQNHTLQNYVNNVRRYTDLLAGKKHPLDRIFETDIFGRSVYKAVNTIESRVGANMVAGNISSAITNFIPITQGMSAMSTGSNLKGMKEAMKYMVKGGMDDITKKSAFLTTREGRQMLYKTGLQKVTDAAVTPMEIIDRFTTQSVWRSRYYENIKKGLDESRAILEADDYSRRLFAGRSKGAMPTYFHSKALKPLTMFQLEVNNQLDFLLKDLPKEAHGSTIKAFQIYSGVFIGAMLYNDVYEKMTGRRAALDPIGMANRALGDFTGTKLRNTVDISKDALTGKGFQAIETGERKKASVAAGKLVENIGGNIPFVGGMLFDGGRIPLSAADPGLGSIGGAVFNAAAGDGSWAKAGSVAVKNLSNPFYYAALPFGGSQLRKTVGGLSTMAKGGSYSTTNNGERLQFPVDQSSPAKWAQAGVLGKWALPEAQGYLNGQTKAFSEKRTSTYEKLKEKGIVNMQAYGAIGQVMQAGSQEEKRSALRTAIINEEGRPIIYYDLLASDKDKEVMDTLQGMGEDDFTIYDCVEQLTDSKTDNRKRNVLINSKMSEESKKYVYREKVTKDDDERIYDFSQAVMNMDEFLRVKNYLYVTKDRSLPTAQKRELFVNWVLEKGYSKGQREVIYESFNIGKKYRR